MHIDDQTYQRNGKTYRRALLRNSYRKNGKVVHDTIANLSMCSGEEIEVMKFALKNKKNLSALKIPGYTLVNSVTPFFYSLEHVTIDTGPV